MIQMVSLLIGVIFYGQVMDQDGAMNMNGALFLFLTNMTFQNVFAVINVSFRYFRRIQSFDIHFVHFFLH